MGKHTDIQWCHSTVNPVAGCDGCELYPSGAKVAQTMLKEIPPQMRQQVRDRIDHFAAQGPQYVKLNLDVIAGEVAELAGAPEIKRPVADAVAALYVCYAASLHRFFNKNGRSSGYAFPFEQPKLFDGRMARAAAWGPPSNEEECSKPWLTGMRRLIFISDMGDALSTSVPFEHLEREIIQAVCSEQGQQHIWQWLTKRPGRMAKFAEWLEQRGQQWPENLVAMTTVTAKEFTSRVSALRDVPAKFKGLSLEPLWTAVDLDLHGIDWVVVGGQSGAYSQPFDLSWATAIRDQCSRQGVAFFLKQLGRNPWSGGKEVKLADPHGGDWSEWPEELRLREMPDAWGQPPMCQ